MISAQFSLGLKKQRNALILGGHIKAFVCFVKNNAKCFVYKFYENGLLGAFETARLNIASIKAFDN